MSPRSLEGFPKSLQLMGDRWHLYKRLEVKNIIQTNGFTANKQLSFSLS